MNKSPIKVGDIFLEAGAAFNRLAEMTMMLHPIAESPTGSQVKTPVKRKVEERISTSNNAAPIQNVITAPISQQVTLNMLNAPEGEMDVEGNQNQVKLEFETSTEDVAT